MPTSQTGFFITATDTDAGKTFLTAGLLRGLLRRGLDALAVKPVQTGCEPDADGTLRAPDVEAYLAAAGDRLPASARRAMTCLTFRRACSPHLAAAQAADGAAPGADILERIQAHVRALPQRPLRGVGA
ncbi:MAG: ATP-dependent dethiobiotin synthetase BioD, partial [Desulfovibrionaceae bacterium]